MTVSAQTPINRSTGNGVTTVFPYTFKIISDADIEVTVDDVVKTLNVDYTVSGAGVDAGGNVTMTGAPANATSVVRRRNMALVRSTDYQDQGELPATTLDNDIDATVLMVQQLDERLDRTFSLPASFSGDSTLPAPEPGYLIGWDATGENLTNIPASVGSSLVDLAAPSGSSLIGYQPAGTGAVATTVQAKLREIISTADRAGTVGIRNIGFGSSVLSALTSGSLNTVVGDGAGTGITTSYGNTVFGAGAMASGSQSGDQNTAIGRFALEANTTGYENCAVGTAALGGATTGNINVAMGRKAALRITTGHENTAIGTNAMGDEAQPGSSTGDGNTAIGRNTLKANTTGHSNTALGRSALATNTTGNNNVAVGQSAQVYQTTGVDNVSVGANSLATNIIGLANVAIGTSALNVATGDRNTAVGNGAALTTTTGTNVICIGDGSTATSAATSNEITLGNSSITNLRVPGIGLSSTSSIISFAGIKVIVGTGSPEGVHTAAVGSMFLRTNGGASTSHYIKESGAGNTGWVAK